MENIIVKSITLEKLAFGVREVMSESLIREMNIESYRDVAINALITQVRGYLWSNKVHHDTSTEQRHYPATIWEELKRDFAPKWFLRKFPIRYSVDIIKHEHRHYHLCPHLNIDTQETHLKFLTLDDVD